MRQKKILKVLAVCFSTVMLTQPVSAAALQQSAQGSLGSVTEESQILPIPDGSGKYILKSSGFYCLNEDGTRENTPAVHYFDHFVIDGTVFDGYYYHDENGKFAAGNPHMVQIKNLSAPSEDGSGAAKAMELAMEEGSVTPEEVQYINAHGTSTHHNDLFETYAIKKAFGDAAKDVVVNSTKSMIGHLLGAAGAVECIVTVKSIQDGFIHQTVGTRECDEECDLNYAVGAPVEKEIKCALTNSLGFGGHNATLLLKKYEG